MTIVEYRKKAFVVYRELFRELTELTKDLNVVISGRVKSIESIKQKMKRKNLSIEQLNDVVGFRILSDRKNFNEIVKRIYRKFDVVEIENFFKNPTDLGYKGIHLVIWFNGFRCEIQVHTNHSCAYALLCHELYKKNKIDGKILKILEELKRALT